MKNLSEYIEEKLIINKNYSCDAKIDYLDKNIDELYFIRFRPEEESIYIDIIKRPLIKPIVHYNIKRTEYELCGDFMLCSAQFKDAQFTLDSHGFLYKLNTAYEIKYDMLLHPSYVHDFKKFVDSFIKQYNTKYSFEDILNMFNLEYDDSLNVNAVKGKQFMLSASMNKEKLNILKNILKKYFENK